MKTEMQVTFPGGRRVDASFDGYVVHTDQPADMGGSGSAATPSDLFLASLGTCAGFYVLAFCQARKIPTDGVSLVQRVVTDPKSHLPSRIDIEIRLPVSFPEKYREPVRLAAEHCKVKATLAAPPVIQVTVVDATEVHPGLCA